MLTMRRLAVFALLAGCSGGIDFEHFPDALRRVYTGANFGKQVLEP